MTSQMTSRDTLTVEQASVTGSYVKSRALKCNGRHVYVNEVNQVYILFSSANQWVVTNGNRARTCTESAGDPYNPDMRAKTPPVSGWLFFDRSEGRYVEYAGLEARCGGAQKPVEEVEVEEEEEVDVGAGDGVGGVDILGGMDMNMIN